MTDFFARKIKYFISKRQKYHLKMFTAIETGGINGRGQVFLNNQIAAS